MKKIFLAFAFLCGVSSIAAAQSTQITTEYLMTMYVPTERKAVDPSLTIVNILPGGWVQGPRISGKIVPPGGDWLRTMPSGALRQEAKLSIETDDGALIYLSYTGVVVGSIEVGEALGKGEIVTDKNFPYFITAAQFQTSAEKYNWLNQVQTVGKMIELKRTAAEAYVKYDIFIVR